MKGIKNNPVGNLYKLIYFQPRGWRILYSIGSKLVIGDSKCWAYIVYKLSPHLAIAKPGLKFTKALLTNKQMSYLTLKKPKTISNLFLSI